MTPTQPLDWIDDLHASVKQSQCRVAGAPATLDQGFSAMAAELTAVKMRNGSVWWVGNGGSSALCSHFSQDLLNKLALRSTALSDPSLLTCMANDYGYPQVYARPLSVLIQKGDLLIAISSSGKSENILNSAAEAVKKGASLVSLTGFEPGNPLYQQKAAVAFFVPSRLYGQVEIGHAVLLHAVIETVWLNSREQK